VFIEHLRDGEKCRRERQEIERLATDEEASAARLAGGRGTWAADGDETDMDF
jgi:hypothetical protein